jgi:hypothetical protein
MEQDEIQWQRDFLKSCPVQKNRMGIAPKINLPHSYQLSLMFMDKAGTYPSEAPCIGSWQIQATLSLEGSTFHSAWLGSYSQLLDNQKNIKWRRIICKYDARWQHVSRLKASAAYHYF